MKKSFLALSLLLSSLASAEDMPSWDVIFPPAHHWHVGYEREQADQYVIEWVRDDETVEDWSELITFMYQEIPQSMYNGVVNEILAGLQQDCPSFGAELLEKADYNITIEWWDDGCGGWPAQRVVVKYVYAGNGFLSLQYAHEVNRAEPDMEQWRTFVLNAEPSE